MAVFAFGIAATMIVALMFATAFAATFASADTAARFRTSGPAVKRWGGRILIGVGIWILALAIFADRAKEIFL